MWKEIRRIFLAGLLVIIPLVITLFTIFWVLNKADSIFRSPIEELIGFRIYGLGLFITFFLIMIAGVIATYYEDSKIIEFTEDLLKRIPLVRSIYFPIKQFTETVYGNANAAFRRSVLVQYPSPGIYAIGFITADAVGEIIERVEKDVISVFIPTTPNPTSGMFVMVPKDDLIMLDIPVEDAIKLVVSGGIAVPNRHKNDYKQ